MDFAVNAFVEDIHFKKAVAGEVFGAELRLREDALVVGDLDSSTVHDVAHRIDGDEFNVPNALRKNDGRLLGS